MFQVRKKVLQFKNKAGGLGQGGAAIYKRAPNATVTKSPSTVKTQIAAH